MASSKIRVSFIAPDNSRKTFGPFCCGPACTCAAGCSGAVLGAARFLEPQKHSGRVAKHLQQPSDLP